MRLWLHVTISQEVGSRLKEKYKASVDEFNFNPHAKNAEVSIGSSSH